jgi:hypothetical protein
MFLIKEKEDKMEEEKQDKNNCWQKKKFSKNENKKELKSKGKLLKKVDQVSFAICFLTFFLFNIIYWNIYL